MKSHTWELIPKEQLNPTFARQVIHTELMTLARVYMKDGCFVPEHHHPNEQVSIVYEGSLKFVFPTEGREVVVHAGDALEIPANLPHSAVALEDTVAMDVFTPPRQDWISGNDAYLRK
ncbi:MAG TPA: cupin domain-containing protein [Bryobacteraceae bacterium]|jgi:quercetin dioxygenase-like cupin family protein